MDSKTKTEQTTNAAPKHLLGFIQVIGHEVQAARIVMQKADGDQNT